ncbi:hypothetical protein F4860DRAFT_510839 [Xylaria cubensis]|nr:hypothetical protein F4860DRAFT_510839 [Xylaria cubensis]
MSDLKQFQELALKLIDKMAKQYGLSFAMRWIRLRMGVIERGVDADISADEGTSAEWLIYMVVFELAKALGSESGILGRSISCPSKIPKEGSGLIVKWEGIRAAYTASEDLVTPKNVEDAVLHPYNSVDIATHVYLAPSQDPYRGSIARAGNVGTLKPTLNFLIEVTHQVKLKWHIEDLQTIVSNIENERAASRLAFRDTIRRRANYGHRALED